MTAPAARTDASQGPRPLPIRPRPMTGEGVASYVRRLARANHMRPGYLHRYLKDLHQDETIRFDWLATLAGRSVIALQYALTDPQRPQAGRPAPRRHAGLNSRKTSKAALFTIIRREAREGG